MFSEVPVGLIVANVHGFDICHSGIQGQFWCLGCHPTGAGRGTKTERQCCANTEKITDNCHLESRLETIERHNAPMNQLR